jgi:hypothetical protein
MYMEQSEPTLRGIMQCAIAAARMSDREPGKPGLKATNGMEPARGIAVRFSADGTHVQAALGG